MSWPVPLDPETPDPLTDRLAARLRSLRVAQGWSLDALALRSGIPRATLSRIETGATSPTAQVLGRLGAAHGLTVSHLMALAEAAPGAKVAAEDRPRWRDPETGFTRTQVSPPLPGVPGEVLSCDLPPGITLTYDAPPVPGQAHHLLMQAGALTLTVDGVSHALTPGDCLRYRLTGPSRFETGPGTGATYLLFLC